MSLPIQLEDRVSHTVIPGLSGVVTKLFKDKDSDFWVTIVREEGTFYTGYVDNFSVERD